jgi:hypothetical protein
MTAYRDWVSEVQALGGVATAWPFPGGQYGQLAARFDVATYVDVFNAGLLPTGAGTQTTSNGQWAYVLATAITQNDAADRSALDLVLPTDEEERAAQRSLLRRWGLPEDLGIGTVGKTLTMAAFVVGAFYVVGQLARGRGSR